MWSADSIDYSRPSVERLINNVMREAKPGGMVLMHDGGGDRSQTVTALPIIIDKLRNQGYKFVTVPELFEMRDKEQQATTATQPIRLDAKEKTSLTLGQEKASA
jgi:chitin deacetylase